MVKKMSSIMLRSVSEPSVGTAGNSTIRTNATSTRGSHMIQKIKVVGQTPMRGEFLWQGKVGKFTMAFVQLATNLWWQVAILINIVFMYILYLLRTYFLDDSWRILEVSLYMGEVLFLMDLIISLLHAFWPIVRLHMRVKRRSYIALGYDAISMLPFTLVFQDYKNYEFLPKIGRWLGIFRIYRIIVYFKELNENMRSRRRLMLILEHITVVILAIHAATCLWYNMHRPPPLEKPWHNLRYPEHVATGRINFDTYLECWYYCSCRTFNVIFADSFPVTNKQKWLTVTLTLVGYVILRYRFIGYLTWELVLENRRWSNFVDVYHHMLRYLKFSGAPSGLVAQAQNYKLQLWQMKDGVLTSDHLKKLPPALQMQLIFDINVGHFHNSLLFRDTGEAFMRHVSLLMRHELFLAGQQIWSQGVVKSGMICIRRGVIEMLSDEDDESPVIAFKEGTVLGELSLFYSIPSKVTVTAATYVELQVLRRTDFMRAMTENPNMLQQIRVDIDKRLYNAKKRQVMYLDLGTKPKQPNMKRKCLHHNIFLFIICKCSAIWGHSSAPAKSSAKQTLPYHPLLEPFRRIFRPLFENLCIRLESRNFRHPTAIEDYDKGDSRLIRTRYRPMKVLKDHLAGVEEEDPTFVDDSHMYYKDEDNIRQPKFTTEFLELYKMSPNVTTVDNPRICLKANFPWILEPDTNFTYVFDLVHFMMVLYVCIMSPYHAIETSQTDLEKVLGIIVIAGLVLNIYIQLTTSIVEKDVKKETVKEIVEVKMASFGFYLDILSVFPMYIFSETLDPNAESVWGQIAKLFPVLQVWHLWDYIGKWERNFNYHVKILCLCKYCLILIIFCYWSGCFLYIFACPKKLCRENSWMEQLIFWETKVFVTHDAKHERPLTSSLSFGTSVFTGSGIADISPGISELVVVVILFVIGSYMNCSYMAKVCSLYLLSTQRRLKFEESMRELFYFLTVNRVSGKIKARVEKFFCVQWYYNSAVSSDEIFKDMSSNIQQEVLSIEMVQTLLFCPLFQDCSRDFLQTVAANTRTVVLPDNEIVQHSADIGRDMYIVQKGHCNVLNHMGKVVMSIGPGNHFGVIEMLFGLPKVYTVITTTNCKLRYVEYSALVQCWSTFPDISHPIFKTLQNPELMKLASLYEEAKPLTGRMEVKINRIAQEIKESFVFLTSREQRKEYSQPFEKLGIMRYIKYVFIPGCITPHGIFLKMWCALRFILASYYIITIPYNIATKQYKHGGGYPYTDIVLYIDIVIMAYVAYYNSKSLLVTHPLLVVMHYLKTTFFWDAISIFPIELVFTVVNEKTNIDLCRMNRLLLVTRITGAFSYWEGDIMKQSTAIVLLKFLPFAIAIVNFMTAFVFMNICTPFLRPNISSIMVNCTRTMTMSDSTRFEIHNATYKYASLLFWVFELFMGCGCTPGEVSGRVVVWLMMALQITGYLYFAFMFGYVAGRRSAAAHALLEHNENTRDLENFLYQENVDPALTAKTMKYFEYVWKRTNGSNPQQICRCLNSALMEDTLVFMYEHALREVPLFGKVERSFIRVITQHLTEMYFLKGETVVQCRDIQNYIYIIYRGKVDVMSSYNEMLTCMGPGGMFGNFTGQPISSSEVSIYASRSLDLLVIPSPTFFNLIKYYPKIREPLNKAFEMSKDYILPISVDVNDETSSDSENDAQSQESGLDSRSGSSRYLMTDNYQSQLTMRSSHSNVSHTKSSFSVGTYQSYMHASNLIKPGSWLFQGFGYLTCFMVTANYTALLYEIITLNDCVYLFWIQSLFDMFFYIKVYLNIHQGYINKRGDLVVDSAKCRTRYVKHKKWLWSDIVVNLPLEMIALFLPNPLMLMHYLRINKLFRLKYLFEFYRKTAAELTNNLTTLQVSAAQCLTESLLAVRPQNLSLFPKLLLVLTSWTTVFVVALLIHTFTCIWLLTLIANSPVALIRTLKMHIIDEETPRNLWDYSTSFYVVLSEMTATGGDEYVIDEVVPMIIMSLSLICGKMLAAIVVATSIQVAYSTKNALNNYERMTNELIDMLKNQGLSAYQLKKFWKYVKQLWTTERGRQLPVLLAQTPYVRRCDLMSAMFGHHLRSCYLFSDTGEPFLRQLTVALDYTIFFPGNYIVVAGDSEARMYYVASGTVSVVSVRPDLTETTHELLGRGDVFGILQGLNRGIAHCFSYRAETKASILTLSLDSWINILEFFPEAKKIIAERAEILFAQI